jgi:NDP-sugar pyrophosphorylase family protein
MAASSARAPRALLLTAGLGTRLRPLTYARAKPAVPVNGTPLVRRILTWLAGYGVDDVVLNLHYRPETIAAITGDGSDLGLRIRYSWEQPVLGSAGGPRHALPLLTDGRDDPFLLVNGDTLTDVDLPALQAAHAASGAQVTMALVPNERPEHYGGVLVSDDGFVTGFTRRGASQPSFHFVGVQVAGPGVFAALGDHVPAESVGRLYPTLMAAHPGSVGAFVCSATFRDIGTAADYLETSLAFAAAEGDRMAQGARQTIADSAAILRTALWDDVTIGRHARLTDCIVCDGVQVPNGAAFERCALALPHDGALEAGERLDGGLLVRPF